MSNLIASPTFDDVPQLELSTMAKAGPGQVMNQQAQALLNRTQFLRAMLEAGVGGGTIFVTANEESFPGITSLDPATATPAFQAFVNACRQKIGYAPGKYFLNGSLYIDPRYPLTILGSGFSSDGPDASGTSLNWTAVCNGFEVVYGYAQWPAGGGADAHVQDDIANSITPLGNSDNLVHLDGIACYGVGADQVPGTRSIQLHGIGAETQPTGYGIFAYWANNLIVSNCWFSGWPSAGAKFMWCFGSKVIGGYYVGNRGAGIVAVNTNNLFLFDGPKIIANGMVTGPFISFNLLVGVEGVSAGSHPNLGVSITNNVDVEGAGGSALPGYGFSHAAGTLTNIVVSGGTATANCTSAPLIAVGHYIGVYGGTVANGGLALNTIRPAIVLTKVGNTITWATSAPNGTYTTGMKIGPYVVGLGLQNCYAATAKIYAEGTTAPAVYIYRDCRGVSIDGSHVNDAKIFVDGFYYCAQVGRMSGGTGYAVNDEVTLDGGKLTAGGVPTKLKVTSTSGGVVTGVTFVAQGSYLEPPVGGGIYDSVATTATIGSGSGLTVLTTWLPDTARGVKIARNQMYGSNGGVYAACHEHVSLEGNQYLASGPEKPTLYLGPFIAAQSSRLREIGAVIEAGSMTSNGINQYIGPDTPADWTNWGSGVGSLLALEASGSDPAAPRAGRRNTAFGAASGRNITSGANNALFGTYAGEGLTTGQQNVIIGAQGSTPIGAPNASNFIGIGYGSQAFAASNRAQIGDSSLAEARVQVSWTVTSDHRAKTSIASLDLGTDFILALQPKSYFRKDSNGNAVGREEMGFIAQDVDAIVGRPLGLVQYDVGTDTYGLRKDDLIAPMVKMLQELHERIAILEGTA